MKHNTFGHRVLLLIPHPDDEVVAAAAAIGRAQKTGAQFFALYLTHGCIARETLWPWQRHRYELYVTRRLLEAEQVAARLNIMPVGWSPRPARHLWGHLPEAYAEISDAVKAYAIDQIWLPAYEGGNADHDALNALGQMFKPKISVLEFAEYNFTGGAAQSHTFPAPNGTEQTLELTPEERALKNELLRTYASEQKNLNYIKTDRECFRPLAVYDYAKPPHPGKLWYARFQWVPFRHPRVDFTQAEEVSETIVRFLRETKEP